MIALVLWATLTGSVIGPAPETPPEITDPIAREHFAAGMQAWLAEDYPTAQRELEAAFDRDAVPVLLYSLGQLSRLQGDCDRSRERFLAFLATDPPAAAAADARVNLDRCEPRVPVVVAPPLEPATDPTIETTPETPPPEPTSAPPKPDRLALALTITGAAIASAGIGVFGGAFAVRSRADDAFALRDFERGVRRADAMYYSGVALMSAGTAVLIGGIVRWVIVARRNRRAEGPSRRR